MSEPSAQLRQLAIQMLIDAAIASNASDVVIPPGTYFNSTTTVFNNATDLTVIADDVLFIITADVRAVSCTNCTNLTIQGLSVNYDPLAFTQGVVISIDQVALTMKVQLDQGYPVAAYNSRIIAYDSETRKPKEGTNVMFTSAVTFDPLLTDVLDVTEISAGINVGDRVTLSSTPNTTSSIFVTNSAFTIWQNITLFNVYGVGYIENDGVCGTILDNFNVVPGPKPAGAIVPPLQSSLIDAINFSNVEMGPTVQNCTIKSPGDDCFSIQTPPFFAVLNASGNSEYIAFRSGVLPLDPGDIIAQFLDQPAIIQSLTLVPYGSFPIPPAIQTQIDNAQPGDPYDINKNGIFLMVFTTVPAFGVGDFVFAPRYSADGFVFQNNTLYSQSRGMLMKGSNGIIQNNMFTAHSQAIVVSPEGSTDTQSGSSQNLQIIGNYFLRTGYVEFLPAEAEAGSLCFTATNVISEKAFNNMLIENNTFDSILGLNIQISQCHSVQVNNNTFLNTFANGVGVNGTELRINQRVVVWIDDSDTVSFSGNVINYMGPSGSVPIVLDPGSTSNITGLPGGLVLITKRNIPIDTTLTYALINQNSGKALQTVGNGTADGTEIEQETFNLAVLSQHWQFIAVGFYFNILHVASGKFLDIAGESIADNANAVIFTPNGSISQQWALAEVANGSTFKITNVNSGLTLNIQNASTANGALVIQSTTAEVLNQNFANPVVP
ncbi:Right handed beta helix region [Paenibacillaceae bacterium GAS479]|nr:Right handed beta helix region [Paenibacillaceae bacterium GAS479]